MDNELYNVWTYKGYECWIEEDKEDDVTKKWHMYRKAGTNDKPKWMPLSPYVDSYAMKLWIDAGCPKSPDGHSMTVRDGKLC